MTEPLVTWVQEHLDELVERFASEDNCSPDEWRQRAVENIARQRIVMEAHMQGVKYLGDVGYAKGGVMPADAGPWLPDGR